MSEIFDDIVRKLRAMADAEYRRGYQDTMDRIIKEEQERIAPAPHGPATPTPCLETPEETK